MKKDRVTVVGSLNYDIIFKQKRLPEVGETLTADSMSFCGGGKGANQAVQLAKLGTKTYMIGAVGKDAFGDYLLESLNKYGVETGYIKRGGEKTGMAVINSLENGSLISTIAKGANYTLLKEDIDKAQSLFEKSKIVILQLEIPMEVVEYAIEIASRNDCFIILNAAPACFISEKILKKVNCLIVNEPEASFYLGEDICDVESAQAKGSKLFDKIKDVLIITLGEKGSLLYDGNQSTMIHPNKVNVVETTGAGDSYVAAFAYQLLNNKGYREAAEFASIVSSLTIQKIGAQDSMPVYDDLKGIYFKDGRS